MSSDESEGALCPQFVGGRPGGGGAIFRGPMLLRTLGLVATLRRLQYV